MRALQVVVTSIAIGLTALPRAVSADCATATATLLIRAEFSSRTSLKVSTRVLQFEVTDSSVSALASLEFSAGVRTREGAEVVLSVEPMRIPQDSRSPDDDRPVLAFNGEAPGILTGVVSTDLSTVVARWAGSGLRAGRLTFALRAARGSYSVPVRFVLTAP